MSEAGRAVLHMFPVAPNAAKVRLYLAEKRALGCTIEVDEVAVNLLEGEQKSDDYRGINPFGTVPSLVTPDGTALFESLSIIEYLEELHPSPSLWGGEPIARARARQLERLVDLNVLIGVGREIHATNSPLGLPPNPPLAEYFRGRWVRVLDYLEGLLGDGRDYLAGPAVTVGDCTLAAAFQFARFRGLPVLEGRPRIEAWDARFRARPSAKEMIVL